MALAELGLQKATGAVVLGGPQAARTPLGLLTGGHVNAHCSQCFIQQEGELQSGPHLNLKCRRAFGAVSGCVSLRLSHR